MSHKVALIDDHPMMRNGLASMINELDDYTVTLQADNGKEFIESLKDHGPPRIAIVDLHMPVMNGFDTLQWLKQNEPDVLSLALTFDGSDDAMAKAIRAGARGFILKNARPGLLKIALDSLILTGYYHSDEMHELMIASNGLVTKEEEQRAGIMEHISPRELEFLMHVCDESEPTYDQIAKAMGIHRRSVDNFRRALFEKFQIKSKTGLVLFAVRYGIVTIE